jgi:hypothetical protein
VLAGHVVSPSGRFSHTSRFRRDRS